VSFLSTCEATGRLLINGVDLSSGPAFFTPNLFDLQATWDVRGDDRLLPGVVGVKAYRRRITVSTHSLPMLVSGHTRYDGTAITPRALCLTNNIVFLRANVLLPPTANPGTRAASLLTPDGTTLTGPVHVLKFEPGEIVAGWMQATLTISIPGGRLV